MTELTFRLTANHYFFSLIDSIYFLLIPIVESAFTLLSAKNTVNGRCKLYFTFLVINVWHFYKYCAYDIAVGRRQPAKMILIPKLL